MDELVIALLSWIDRNSGFDTREVPPPIVRELSASELTQEAYRDSPTLAPASGIDARAFALYSWDDDPRGVVYILDARQTPGLQLGESPHENPVFRERLLHELVHHVQYHTGAFDRFACPKQGEKQAYLLGGHYLRQSNAEDPLPNRSLLAHLYSRC